MQLPPSGKGMLTTLSIRWFLCGLWNNSKNFWDNKQSIRKLRPGCIISKTRRILFCRSFAHYHVGISCKRGHLLANCCIPSRRRSGAL